MADSPQQDADAVTRVEPRIVSTREVVAVLGDQRIERTASACAEFLGTSSVAAGGVADGLMKAAITVSAVAGGLYVASRACGAIATVAGCARQLDSALSVQALSVQAPTAPRLVEVAASEENDQDEHEEDDNEVEETAQQNPPKRRRRR